MSDEDELLRHDVRDIAPEDEPATFAACVALCTLLEVDAVVVVTMRHEGGVAHYITGKTDGPNNEPMRPEHLVPLLVATRGAALDIETQLAVDARFTNSERWLRYVQAIPSGYGITEARVFEQAPGLDLVRVWFEGHVAGEFVLPKGRSDLFLMTLGLKLAAAGAS